MNGAQILVRTLSEAGVTTVFSLSGNQIMPVFDACLDAGIRIVHVRHESAAVYMADAWAQVTGSPGVAMVTAGAGFANALGALITARHSESPVLLLSGDSPVSQDGMAAFQELAQGAIASPLVKATLRPRTADAMAAEAARAIRTAVSGRPGPVHMALPADVLEADGPDVPGGGVVSLSRPVSVLDHGTAEAIADRLSAARRPLILTGPTLKRDVGRLDRLSDQINVPVVAMESPRGLRDPSLGTFAARLAEADLIVSLGKPLDFTLGFARPPACAPDADWVVVDPEAAAVDRAHRLAGGRLVLAVQADADMAADSLIAAARPARGDAWRGEVAAAVAERTLPEVATDRIHPKAFCAAIQRSLNAAANPVLVCDGGEIGQWAQAFCSAPTRLINGTAGAIGAGLCYAVAAKIARPEAPVFAVMGDGSAGFHLMEFDTAARENAAMTVVIGNDFRWNAEHQIQIRTYGEDRTFGCRLSPAARYDRMVAALDGHGEHVTDAADLDTAMERALASGRPACVNVEIEGLPAPDFSPPAAGSH